MDGFDELYQEVKFYTLEGFKWPNEAEDLETCNDSVNRVLAYLTTC